MKVTYKGMLPPGHGGSKAVITFYLTNRRPTEMTEAKEADSSQESAVHNEEFDTTGEDSTREQD